MIAKTITEAEKAAIFYGLRNGANNATIYAICHPRASAESCASSGAQWVKSAKIKNYYERQKAMAEDEKRLMEMGRKAAQDPTIIQEIDFTDKAQFIKYLNEAANRMTDDKLKNDILKMLSDHLDFKDEQKRGESAEIQRFYLPLRCQDCKIYQAAAVQGEK